MGVVVKYVQQVGGRYVYRRAVPEMLRSALNKREVKIPLGKSQAEMTRRYGPTHAEVEKLFKLTRASLALVPQSSSVEKTDLDLFNEAIERIQSNGWSAEFDVLPDFQTVLSWNFPIMIPMVGEGEFHEEVEVYRSADRVHFAPGG